MSTAVSSQQPLALGDAEHALGRRRFIKHASTGLLGLGGLIAASGAAAATRSSPPTRSTAGRPPADADNFYESRRVTVRKVRFKSQYDMDVAGNLFVPNELNRSRTRAAVVVGHPMGATKEQSANLYATKMAEQGFVTLSIDLPLLGREQRPSSQPRITGLLRRRFQCGRRLPRESALRGPGAHRRPRHLR